MRPLRRSVVVAGVAALLFAFVSQAAETTTDVAAKTDRAGPNVVLIIGDDQSYPDFGFMGHPIVKTPHLDRLAREGTHFRVGYTTASWCRTALQTLLTGLYL